MTKRSIIIITGIVTFNLLVVVVLSAISEEPFSYRQSFIRTVKADTVRQLHVLDLDEHYAIAGVGENRIFFSNTKDITNLLVTDTTFQKLTPIHISIPKEAQGGTSVEIDSPFFYVKASQVPAIYRGTMDNWQATKFLDSLPYFTNAVSLTPNSFAFQMTGNMEVNAEENKNILCKTQKGVASIKANPAILAGTQKNYFSANGMLRYSKYMNQLVYTYFYRNEYLLIDTVLNLAVIGNTLDTVSQAHIKPIEVSKGKFTFASTPAVVNRNAQVYKNYLLIHSDLMAKNETQATFDNNSVIDVYDLRSRTYQYSFYLPDYRGSKVRAFKVIENRIIAAYNNNIVLYSFTLMPEAIARAKNILPDQ